MRLIQVGLGGFGRSWSGVVRASVVELVAAVDPSPAAREWAGTALGLTNDAVFDAIEGAMAAIPADAVLIVTPPETHHALGLAALRSGKHVLLEKPLAVSLAEAGDLVSAAEAAERFLMVSQNYRFRPVAREARRIIAAGMLGALTAVKIRCLRDTRALWSADNFRYAMPHPFVLDMSIHHADLLRAVTGEEVTSLYARRWRVPDSPYRHDPAVAAVMTLSGGATVLYEGDWATREPETSWNGDWEFIGERGRLTWRGDPADALAGSLTLHLAGTPSRVWDIPALPVVDRAASLLRFQEAVATGQEPETSARDNMRSLAIVLGCVESIESGKVVTPGA